MFNKSNVHQNSKDVCLINMPYAEIVGPSLALGSLKVSLTNAGINSKIISPNLWFAEEVGLKNYQLFAYVGKGDDMMIWDWTFSNAAFPEMKRNDEEYLAKIYNSLQVYEQYPGEIDSFIDSCRKVRDSTVEFIDKVARRILATGTKVVACTSTLRQHVPSIALLRKIKELDPSVITMIGGANCATEMGMQTHKSFEWIDFVMSGEGEEIIVELCKKVLKSGVNISVEELPLGVFGPIHRINNNYSKIEDINSYYAIIKDLDNLPIPDFGDYFDEIEECSFSNKVTPGIVIQTSRGCWWGQAHQCTFCGLNGANIGYRAKSPKRALDEFRTLESKYGCNRIVVVDNILDMKYFDNVLPELASDNKERWMFYETKANLKKKHIEMLKKSGICWIEPGIESLHSKPLKLMSKGSEAWQNIQLLKWSRQYGVRTYWNLIWGFPGENDDWYMDMSKYVPLLEHLHPPARLIELLYHRYSEYYNHPEQYGLKLIPHPALPYIYPLSIEQLKNLTYSFFLEENNIYESEDNLETDRLGILELRRVIKDWIEKFWHEDKPILSMKETENSIEFIDTRTCSKSKNISIKGIDKLVYSVCGIGPKKDTILDRVNNINQGLYTISEIEESIDRLKQLKLVIDIDKRIISLAIENVPLEMPTWDQTPFGVIKDAGHI